MAAGLALVGWTPMGAVAPAGCLLAGLGFYMLHNTLQANATEMTPERRGAGMALGQSAGVAVAGGVAESIGAVVPILAAAFLILPLGFAFAWAKNRQKLT
jgi:hypothetical protein